MRNLVVPYDPRWKAEFEALREVYGGILHTNGMDIQHVGSTAVPGLHAKPVLDIDIIINDANLFPGITGRLEEAGYEARGNQGIPDRYAFRQQEASVPWTIPRRTWMEHHLYVCMADSLAVRNHLCFRDALLADPVLVKAYGNLKCAIAQMPGMDRQRYWLAKTEFILRVLAERGFSAAEIQAIEAVNR